AEDAEDGGGEVGEALADPGAGLDEQVGAGLHRLGDCAGHDELLLAGLVAGAEGAGDGAVCAQHALDCGQLCLRCGHGLLSPFCTPSGARFGSPARRGYVLPVRRVLSSTTMRPVGVGSVPAWAPPSMAM